MLRLREQTPAEMRIGMHPNLQQIEQYKHPDLLTHTAGTGAERDRNVAMFRAYKYLTTRQTYGCKDLY